jgi:transposase InsO family protein
MLTEKDLLTWYSNNGTSEETQAVIARIRSSDPARRVGGGRRNVVGRYPSRKMRATIQFESHRVELAAIYELEHDRDVSEYYDQPPTFKLDYLGAAGRRLGVLHTADFFVIRRNHAGWEECKTQEDLNRLAQHNENRYQSADGGGWRCPPGEAYAVPLGLYYRVRSSGDINWVFQRNIQFLDDYLHGDVTVISSVREAVIARVGVSPGSSLQELFDTTAGIATRDDIYSLIAAGEIHADIHSESLTEPDRILLFRSEAEASSGLNEASKPAHVAVRVEQQTAAEVRLRKANEHELAIANERLRHVTLFLKDMPPGSESEVPARTLRRWVAAYRDAESNLGSGYLGLLPEPRRGNTSPKLPEDARAVMNEFIASDYETLKQKTKYSSWIGLKLTCDQRGIVPPSYKAFSVAVLKRPEFEQTLKRQGPRAAYPQEAFYWQLEFRTPPHGDRPFEIGHIDHTELDVESVCSRTGRGLGRIWLTLLTDACSRRILAVYLTFDPPSYRSCMMVLRECVRRHSRLPQIVVVDGGREFQSTYFETLLARYESIKKTRPAAKPRFGSVCERLFGTANTQFIHNLKGNTQLMVRVRQVTQSVNPKGQAVWPFEELHQRLTEYAYEVYDTIDHPALGQTPREAFESGLAKTGQRAHRQIPYDREFLILTLPTTVRGTAKLVPGKGVQIHYLFYWSDVFRNPEVERQNIPVRYDPFDAGTSYAFVSGQWAECHSEHYVVFHGRSEREVMLASQELRRTRQQHSQQLSITAAKLANFLQSVEAQEVLLQQRLTDAESRRLREPSSGAPVVQPTIQLNAAVITASAPVNIANNIHLYGEM